MKIKSAHKKIKKLQERYYKAIMDKENLINLISEVEISDQVYNSNAIENSTLTLEDTEKILLQIDLDRYITEREIFEAKNLAKVVEYINNNAKDKELDLNMILFLHKILISNIRDDIAGRFRKENEFVKVGKHIAPDPKEVLSLMTKMILDYKSKPKDEIISNIARLHLNFENIHPFIDGNGRIGRVINNYLLIREGFVPINIKFIDRDKYYQAFREYDLLGKIEIMEEIVFKAMTNSYYKRLAYLEGKRIITLNQYIKENKLSHSGVSNKANRQTIEAFLERGVWKIGV